MKNSLLRTILFFFVLQFQMKLIVWKEDYLGQLTHMLFFKHVKNINKREKVSFFQRLLQKNTNTGAKSVSFYYFT